ncbi:MAG: dihydroorotase family protein [Desulfovibrio sp.]|jgi:dihydroorotase-like cyclic amidohydrolase|nr:dihydroorotase family protein [Desulfovibrio sp.]
MYDLIIKNGTIATPTESYPADVGVCNGRIQAIAANLESKDAEDVIDAKGLHVLPGLWHTHCHFRDPGMTNKEDFESGSRCAAAGGITFIIDMTNNSPMPSTPEIFLAKKENAEAKSLVDFGLYGAGLDPKQVRPLVDCGAIGIKVFNTRHPKEAYPYISELGVVNHGLLHHIYEEVQKTGLVCAVHHDDSDWTKYMVFRDYINIGKIDAASYVDAVANGYMYGHGMVSGLASSLYLAKLTDVRLYVLHVGVMPEYAYDIINFAKSNGQTVYSELEACSFLIDRPMADRLGPYAYIFGRNLPRAYSVLKNGPADVLVLEHAPHHRDEVEPGWKDNFSGPLGVIGIQEFVPLMLNEINKGTVSLEHFLKLTTENPARIFGQYPRKGALAVNSDADITIVDMNKEQTLSSKKSLSRSGWTAFDGVRVKGSVEYTIVRGSIVHSKGTITGKPGWGRMSKGKPGAV